MVERQFELLGGALCLDFLNTIHEYGAKDPREELHGLQDLIAFGHQTEALTEAEARLLLKRSEANPAMARKTLSTARKSRRALYRIFTAIQSGKNPSSRDLDFFNQQLMRIFQNLRLRRKGRQVIWSWKENHRSLERVLWPIVHSAAELLTSEDLPLVRECGSQTCTWLFLDRSKNRTRRWCDMKTCGNRAKWRRYYNKHKKNTRAASS